MRRRKNFAVVEFKALPDEGEGVFEAYVSIFGTVDLGGDRVVKGAFQKSLERWKASGDPIPIIFNHEWGNLDAHIGYVDPKDVVEDAKGLRVKRGVLDVTDSPAAARVWQLMKERRLKEFSFAYDIMPGGGKLNTEDHAYDLTELDIIEIGPTLKGMHPDTELVAVKAWVELTGSVEELQDGLRDASRAWAVETYGEDKVEWVTLEATYSDSALFSVYFTDGSDQAFYEAPFTAEDGTVELGEPKPVEVQAQIVEKARARQATKQDRPPAAAGKGLQSAHDLIVGLGAKCSTDGGNAGAANDEESPGTKSEELAPDVAAVAVEMEALAAGV